VSGPRHDVPPAEPDTAGPEADDAALLAAAREAAEAAASVHAEARGGVEPSRWSEKGRSDFVTEVDVEAERRIVAILRHRFPGHGILAEEGSTGADGYDGDGAAPGQAAPGRPGTIRWIIDPLDGTTNWLHGYPEYAVSLAAADAAGPRVGLVLNSATGERFEAVRGAGARRDGAPIRVSEIASLRLALVGTGFPFKKLDSLPAYLEAFSRVLRATSGIRRGGSAALDLCDLACGRLDAFFEYWLMPWDVAAGGLIVREAGGCFGTLDAPGVPPPDAAVVPGLPPGGYIGANAALARPFRLLVAADAPDAGRAGA
jgi:myo-inositol-1(or 4)-monophosphatase